MGILDDMKSIFSTELKDNLNQTVKLNAEYIKQLEDVLMNLDEFDETIQLLNEHLEKTIKLQENQGGNGGKSSDKAGEGINKLKDAIGKKSSADGATGKSSGAAGGKNIASAATKGIGGALSKALSGALMKGIMTAVKGLNVVGLIVGLFDSIISKGIEIAAEVYENKQKQRVLDIQEEQNLWRAGAEARLAALDAGGKILTRNMQAAGKTQQAVLSSATAQITQGAQEGAFAAAKAMDEAGAQSVKRLFDNQMDLLIAQNTAAKASLTAAKANLQLQHERARLDEHMIEYMNDTFDVGLLDSDQAAVDAMKKTNEADRSVATAQAEADYEKASFMLQMEEKKAQIIRDAVNAAMDIAQGVVNQVLDLTKAVEKVFNETEKHALATANLLGMGGNAIKQYNDFFFQAQKNLKFNDSSGKTVYLDKNNEDMAKMQAKYNDATGRNQMMGQDDLVKSFQLGKVLGDDNLAATLLGDMDYFNKSIAEGTDLIYDMFKQANKAGVSNKKFAKDLQKNLKLAQKYTFKGGIKGMMEMSLWAQKTRFNMESIGEVVEKGLKGGLQGAIEQSAKLQVLGGKAGMLSNPLAMLYEFGNDPGAAAKRINEMTEGFGRLNSQTGEVDFSMSDNLQLRAIAEAYGMDPTELRNQATQKIKSQHIDQQLNGNYTDEQKALIYNKAQLDPETKKWMVTMADGTKKDVNDIQDNEWVQLMPTEEAIEDHVSKIHDLLAQTLGAQNYSNAVLADGTKDILSEEQKKRIDNSLTLVHENYETTSNLIKMGAEHATESQKNANDALIASTGAVKEMFDNMELSQKDAVKQLNEFNNKTGAVYNALGLVKAELTGDKGAVQRFKNAILEAAGALADLAGVAGPAGQALGSQASSDAQVVGDIIKDMFDNDKDFESQVNESYKELTTYMKNNHLTDLNNLTDKQRSEVFEIFSMGNISHRDLIERMSDRGLLNSNYEEDFTNRGAQALLDGLKVWQNTYKEEGYTPKKLGAKKNAEVFHHQNADLINYDPSSPLMADGFAQANGTSMMTSAAKVTAINDGSVQLAQSHPQDSALFAKAGGPFDTLFNKVFSKVDNIYNSLAGNGGSTQSIAPIQLNVSGELNLKSDGQSVDLLGMIQNNPSFLATMSQMIVTQLSRNVNGGKTGMFDWLRSIK